MKRFVIAALCAMSFAACASKSEPVAPAVEATQTEKSSCGCSHKAAKKVACGGKSCTCEKGHCGK